jgi:hypothetical protein
MVQTCFGRNGHFYPMMRPLFQARCLGVIAGSCTLGIFCPPYRPPNPSVGIALTMDNSTIAMTALDLSYRCTMPRMHQTASSPIRLMLQGARKSAMCLAISFELAHLFQQRFRSQSAKSICGLGARARNQATINMA